MSKFKFKYDQIKHVKAQIEKQVKKELAAINLQIDECIGKRKSLEEETQRKKLNLKKNARLHQLQFQKKYESAMKLKIESIEQKIKLLKAQRQDKLNELIEKSKQHKIFNSLEEKHLEKFSREQNKIEMKGIDEIATKNYIRSNS